ncbi:MAG TPA: hypothetical protein VFQ65_06765, partial [Kofleriaceae bacterium]|nr:hypothetical protein [Kofleriaceae bacterium]
ETVVVVRGSTAVLVYDHEPPNGGSTALTPAGKMMQTIQWGSKIWVIDPANQSSVLASGLANPRSAVRDDVALAVGVSAAGDLVLERYHTGTGREEITIEHGVDQTFASTVIVTAEGDAIVGGVDDTYVVPAAASVAAHLNLPNVGLLGFSRGDSTVVVAGSALYAYDELGPGPRLTMLVAPLSGLEAVALDPDSGAPTNYFAYGFFTQVARITYTGTTPALVEAACVGMPSQAHLVGRDRNGVPIAVCGVDSESYVFELEPTGPKAVAHFESSVRLYEDRRLADHPVVAWGGQSVHAPHDDVICLASQPDRCWRIPFLDSPIVLTHADTTMNVDSVADTFSVLVEDISPTSVDLWVVRPLGPGEEPQPLP